MRQIPPFLLCLFSLFFCTSIAQADNKDIDWYKIDRIGIPYSEDNPAPLGKNIWRGYNQAEAIAALNKLPDYLIDGTYRDITRQLLLAESRAKRENVQSPSLLIERLNLLIQYGLFEDAKALYDVIPSVFDKQIDPGLALVGLKLNLLENDLSALCLDIRAAVPVVSSQEINELKEFCGLRFSNNENDTNTEFKSYPSLKNFINNNEISIKTNMQSTESLVAHAAGIHFSVGSYNSTAKDLSGINDLTIYMALDDRYKNYSAYQCYAIEAAKRGLVAPDQLAAFYKDQEFEGDTTSKDIYSCQKPAYFYQKLLAAHDNTEFKKEVVNSMLAGTLNLPASALAPFVDDIAQYATGDKFIIWRAGIILALAGKSLNTQSLSEPIMPLESIQSSNQIDFDEYEKWLFDHGNQKWLHANDKNLATPLCLSSINRSGNIKLQSICKENEYEKLFSLTYAKKSVSLGLSLDAYMAELIDDDNTPGFVTKTMSLLGKREIRDLSTRDVVVILSALKASKFEKETKMLTYKYLQ